MRDTHYNPRPHIKRLEAKIENWLGMLDMHIPKNEKCAINEQIGKAKKEIKNYKEIYGID